MSFVTKQWLNWPSSATIVDASALIDLETRLAAYTDQSVYSVTAIGDGVTNDAAAFIAAIAACPTGGVLRLDPGKTYLIGSQLVLNRAVRIEGNGATIKKNTTISTSLISITGSNVELRDLTVDGNRTNNTNVKPNIVWHGAGGTARRVKSISSRQYGWDVTDAGCVLDAYECEGSDHVGALGAAGDGFFCESGALLRTHNCKADRNSRSGYFFNVGSAADCHLDGSAIDNSFQGAYITSQHGTIGSFYADNNTNYGLFMMNADNWTGEALEINNTGTGLRGVLAEPSGTAIEMQNCDNNAFASVITRDTQGYGVSLDKTGSGGCNSNFFDSIDVYGAGDPCVHISGDSNYNSFGTIRAWWSDCAVSFGEGLTGGARGNRFGFVHALQCNLVVIRMDTTTSFNSFEHILAEDCNNTGLSATYQALIQIYSGCNDNVFNFVESYNPTLATATYVMKCEGTAANNRVLGGIARGLLSLSDAAGSNRVVLTNGTQAITQVADYTLVASDAGVVVEGTKGTAQIVTVPPNSSVAFPIGTLIQIVQMGAGQITLTAGAGVTLRTARTLTTRALYSVVELRKRGTDEWIVSGDLT